MYEFIDAIEFSDSVSLPSEALKINGEYIENQVTGYRTLYVSGRESFVKELEIYDSGIRDGSMVFSSLQRRIKRFGQPSISLILF